MSPPPILTQDEKHKHAPRAKVKHVQPVKKMRKQYTHTPEWLAKHKEVLVKKPKFRDGRKKPEKWQNARENPSYAERLSNENDAMQKWNTAIEKPRQLPCEQCNGEGQDANGMICESCNGEGTQ